MPLAFDPLYLLLMLPGMAVAGWAQTRIASAYREGSRYRVSSGVTGAKAAAVIMRSAGVDNVPIEPVAGQLTDHYDPSKKIFRLSADNYQDSSLAAVGVAAHEAGHAIQDASHYPLLVVRNLIVPLAGIGSNISFTALLAGVIFQSMTLVWVGILLFSTVVVFQLVNLPVEFDASRRARGTVEAHGVDHPRGGPGRWQGTRRGGHDLCGCNADQHPSASLLRDPGTRLPPSPGRHLCLIAAAAQAGQLIGAARHWPRYPRWRAWPGSFLPCRRASRR